MTTYFDPMTAALADVRRALDEACARWTQHLQSRYADPSADVAQIDASMPDEEEDRGEVLAMLDREFDAQERDRLAELRLQKRMRARERRIASLYAGRYGRD